MMYRYPVILLICIIFFFCHTAFPQRLPDVNIQNAQQTPAWVYKSQEPLKNIGKYRIKAEGPGNGQKASHISMTQTQETSDASNSPPYLSGQVFIKFKTSVAGQVIPFSDKASRNAADNGVLDKMLGNVKIDKLERFTESRSLKNARRVYKATLDEAMPLEEALAVLNQQPGIEYAEKVPAYYTLQAPDDPSYENGNQHALDLIHAVEAFGLLNNTNEISLAIVDDAFLFDHPDLTDNVDRSKCYDVADDDDDTRPPAEGDNMAGPQVFSHGTHVGGIAGAVTNNNTGIASISHNKVKLFGIKATSDDTDDISSLDSSFEGVQKAIENDAKIINMSFGGVAFSNAWQDMINDATAQGVIFVSAAGNGNTSVKSYPGAYDNVIAVANTDEMDRKNASSHYGPWVDISAPGTGILSTVTGSDGTSGAFTSYSGTSMAAPMVAGLIGLMLSENPSLNHEEVLGILQSSSDGIDAVNPGFEGGLGAGRINAYNAMLAVMGLAGDPVAGFISSEPAIYSGQSVTFSSQSLGNGLSYSWSFPGGTPSTATGQSVEVTYNQGGIFDVGLTVENVVEEDQTVATNYVEVVVPQECEIIAFPFSGTRSFYNFVDADNDNKSQGPVVGHNVNGYNKYANKYTSPPGYYISGGLFPVGKVVSENPADAIVSFKIWDHVSATGRPGRELASQDISFDDLVTSPRGADKNNRDLYTEVIFDDPATVPEGGSYFMGFEIYYAAGDTVGFYTNEEGEGDELTSFLYTDGQWFPFQAIEFAANIEMSPVLIDEVYLDVDPFTAEAGACAGGSINFNAEAIQNVAAYAWSFPGGESATSDAVNPVVQYNTPGTYEATLILTIEGCEVARRKLTQTINIVDCTLNPVAGFTADKLTIAAGDSVHFISQSSNATGFSWIFEEGTPTTASIENPFIQYNTPGTYQVRLEVQNPNAEANQLVKEDYITVLEADACDINLNIALNNPYPGTPTLFTIPEEGYVSGTNSYGDLAKAEYFGEEASERELSKLEVSFGAASTDNDNATVDVVIFNDNGINGSPGDVIATKAIRIADIIADINNISSTDVVFDEKVLIEGAFYAGFLLDFNNDMDTVAVLSSNDDEVTEGTSWEQLADGAWIPSSERWSSNDQTNPLDISLHISAFFDEPSKVPYASLGNVADTIGLDTPLVLDATGSLGYESFEWEASPGVEIVQGELVQTLSFSQTGTYTVSFTAINQCSRRSTHTTQFVVTEDLVLGNEEETAPDKLPVAAYPNPFEDQTSIAYYLDSPDMVLLEVWNSFGQKVRTLVNEKQGTGDYIAVFDATGLSSGLFIFRLQIGDKFVHSGRVILK